MVTAKEIQASKAARLQAIRESHDKLKQAIDRYKRNTLSRHQIKDSIREIFQDENPSLTGYRDLLDILHDIDIKQLETLDEQKELRTQINQLETEVKLHDAKLSLMPEGKVVSLEEYRSQSTNLTR